MTKQKTVWSCVECGHAQPKWTGQCPQCESWNSFNEEVELAAEAPRFEAQEVGSAKPVRLDEVTQKETVRIPTGIHELDRVLGGGVVKGALSLVGGDPGIGKSTLLMQASEAFASQGLTVLYICGEESVEQTSLRARRLGAKSKNLLLLAETNYTAIRAQVDAVKPDILIVDSIQIIYKSEISSAPGSVTQVRDITTEFMHLAKGRGIATFLIGHVTKAGELAGPRVLEHLVDTVLYFEGDRQHNYRLVRVVKNRFGSTDEIAVFQMGSEGLSEVPNPSQLFLEERMRESSGSTIIPTIEGSRPILIEVQALVTSSAYPTPSRRCAGLDSNRLGLLLAVLEKRARCHLQNYDVFVSVAGGMRIKEPAVDLGILLAVSSSLANRVLDPDQVVMGEVGLGGEVRRVPRIEARIKEAIHMGFRKAVIPKRNLKAIPEAMRKKIAIQAIDHVGEVISREN